MGYIYRHFRGDPLAALPVEGFSSRLPTVDDEWRYDQWEVTGTQDLCELIGHAESEIRGTKASAVKFGSTPTINAFERLFRSAVETAAQNNAVSMAYRELKREWSAAERSEGKYVPFPSSYVFSRAVERAWKRGDKFSAAGSADQLQPKSTAGAKS